MEQTTDAEKVMAVFEFLDFKRKNKVLPFPIMKLAQMSLLTSHAGFCCCVIELSRIYPDIVL